jgi:division protein CdvB (Snf7/Vps24/ESCRT-III family)
VRQQQLLQKIKQHQQMWQKKLNNSAPSPSLGYNLQQQQQQQKQQQKLPTIDEILAEEERRILSDFETLEL